ncbi:MAG: hypothetical protein LHW44_04170 [Candidatus Cloacimonetes bacterium]|nr:hypothetical protein [Candidatus Cloacimonadota bacterium]
MGAVGWLRFRQEKQELNHWLSYAFVPQERSWENTLYLIYLAIFFSVWWFVVLVFFAGGGATILTGINPEKPHLVAIIFELCAFLIWFVFAGYRGLRRSPVVFSEEDAYLVCQMPLNPRKVCLRWMLIPWLKSLLPFAVFAITLGFSLAEITLVNGEITITRLMAYASQGLQALLVCIPFHLILFTLVWVIGVLRMNARRMKRRPTVAVLVFGLLCLFLLSQIGNTLGLTPGILGSWYYPAVDFFLAGFGYRSLGVASMIGWCLAAICITLLWIISDQFSPSWAAQETKEIDRLKSLERYGFSFQARELRIKRRLRLRDNPAWTPGWEGPAALIWKDLLQYWRGFSGGDFFDLLFFISSMMGFIYLPTLSSRFFVIVFWAMQTAKLTTTRLQNDLSRWVIFKQLPMPRYQWILAELSVGSLLVGAVSLIGMALGSILAGRFLPVEVMLLPGMIVSVAGMASFDLIRKARTDLMLRGSSPTVSELSTVGGALCAGIPVILETLIKGWPGKLIAILASMLIAVLMLNFAVDALRTVDQP